MLEAPFLGKHDVENHGVVVECDGALEFFAVSARCLLRSLPAGGPF